jgi:hypothetical protein
MTIELGFLGLPPSGKLPTSRPQKIAKGVSPTEKAVEIGKTSRLLFVGGSTHAHLSRCELRLVLSDFEPDIRGEQ